MTIRKKKRDRKITLDLTGPDGNAYVVLGTVSRLMRQLDFTQAAKDAIINDMMSGDYEHLIQTAEKHFGAFIDFYR